MPPSDRSSILADTPVASNLVGGSTCAVGRDAEARLALVLERLHGLVLYETGGGREYISPNVESLLGYTAEELTADRTRFPALIHPVDAPSTLALVRRWHAQGSPGTLTMRFRVQHREGAWVWLEDRMIQVTPEQGRPYMTGVLADISLVREMEEQTVRSEERNSALVAALPDSIFLFDREGRYLDYHAGPGTRLYAPPQEFLGRRMLDVWRDHDADLHQRHLDRVFETGRMQVFEYEIGPADDARHHEVRLVPCGRERVLAIVRNITSRKRAEQAYLDAIERQRLILSELDHRLRNNLASLISLIDLTAQEESHSIRSFASLLRSRVQAMASVHTLLSRTHGSSARLGDLVRAVVPPDLVGRVQWGGPALRIIPRQAAALAMVLQELLFNSIKYGSLSAADGRVLIDWQLRDIESPGSDVHLELRWREQGGPHPDRSPRLGAGTSLLTGLVSAELNGRIDLSYPAGGADHRLSLRIAPV